MQDVPIVSNDDAVEVAFEDVATDVRIVPLISDDPIGACNELHCYGNEVFMSDSRGEYIYYFVDGKLQSTLHAVGRGPGEYSTIAHFTYSPSKKLLLVSALGDINEYMKGSNSMVMKYTVPDMKFVGKIPVEGKIATMSCQDGDKMLCVTTAASMSLDDLSSVSLDTSKVIIADIETGETIRKIQNVSYYEFLQSDILQAPGKNLSNNICVGGYVNKIFHCEDGKQTLAFAFTFGKKNIPANCVESSGFYVESIALANLVCIDSGNQRVVFNTTAEVLNIQFIVEAAYEIRAGGTVYNIPQLSLAPIVRNARRVFIVGMHLNGNIVHSVDKLDQQGKSVVLCTV